MYPKKKQPESGKSPKAGYYSAYILDISSYVFKCSFGHGLEWHLNDTLKRR